MTNANDVRRAHELVDAIGDGRILSSIDVDFLRSFLPERPKPVTLADLLDRVHDAWISANPSDWGFDTPAEHHDWLFDLRNDLVRIIEDQDTPATVPALPAGMRLADHAEYGRVVTSPKPDQDGIYDLLVPKPKFETGAGWEYAHECELTFIDAEPAKPAHPEFLETEADYRDAPVGTVAIREDGYPWTRIFGSWVAYSRNNYSHSEMAALRGKARILRWGDAK